MNKPNKNDDVNVQGAPTVQGTVQGAPTMQGTVQSAPTVQGTVQSAPTVQGTDTLRSIVAKLPDRDQHNY
jgi:hypothetical protein